MNKKCPFCGNDARYVISSYELVGGPTVAEGYIKCGYCKAEGPKVPISNDYHYEEPPIEKIDKMWELWNKRLEVTLDIVDFDTVIAILKEFAEYKNLAEDDLSKRQHRCVTDMVKRFEEMKKEMWEDYWKVNQKTENPFIFHEDISRDEVM